MPVTLYRQVDKGQARRYQKRKSRSWAPPRRSHRSLLRCVKFLRDHESDLDDRTVQARYAPHTST